MTRASIAAEKAGFPVATLVCEGFVVQAKASAAGLGIPNLPIAALPGHVDAQTREELARNVVSVTLDQVVKALTVQPPPGRERPEPAPGEIVFKGTFEEVNRFFLRNQWSDGLPVVPPAPGKIEEFLAFTDHPRDEVLGVLKPDSRELTVWNIAANGVMAGCRPEYMPLLVALGQAMADPGYGVEHSGNTPGAETLITLNGPIVKELSFNYEQGALRDGFQPNTAVGRFWRLLLRNVAGFIPHLTDKATFGGTWKVVLAENEDALAKIGWDPTSVDQGFAPGDNVVTVSRHTGSGVITSVFGQTPEEMLPYIAERISSYMGWEIGFTVLPTFGGTQRPHLVLTPVLAETIAKAGWSKRDVKHYLYDHARMPAWKADKFNGEWTNVDPEHRSLGDYVESGTLGPQFRESDDANRLIPIVCSPDDFLISVSGDPLRTNAYIFISNGILGYTTSKPIELPANWAEMLKKARPR